MFYVWVAVIILVVVGVALVIESLIHAVIDTKEDSFSQKEYEKAFFDKQNRKKSDTAKKASKRWGAHGGESMVLPGEQTTILFNSNSGLRNQLGYWSRPEDFVGAIDEKKIGEPGQLGGLGGF